MNIIKILKMINKEIGRKKIKDIIIVLNNEAIIFEAYKILN